MKKDSNLFKWLTVAPAIMAICGFLGASIIARAFDKSKDYTDQRTGQLERKIDIIIDKQEHVSEDVAHIRGVMDAPFVMNRQPNP